MNASTPWNSPWNKQTHKIQNPFETHTQKNHSIEVDVLICHFHTHNPKSFEQLSIDCVATLWNYSSFILQTYFFQQMAIAQHVFQHYFSISFAPLYSVQFSFSSHDVLFLFLCYAFDSQCRALHAKLHFIFWCAMYSIALWLLCDSTKPLFDRNFVTRYNRKKKNPTQPSNQRANIIMKREVRNGNNHMKRLGCQLNKWM